MVNYYRDMWPKRSETLAPLTSMTSTTAKFQWTLGCQQVFQKMKKIIATQTLLTYPNFHKPIIIHTDASKVQVRACISQEGKPIAFYSRKLNPAQTRYTTTERELLSIVETLKEFRTILFGQRLIVYTDHENLTYNKFTSDRVMRWRLYLEKYRTEIHWIKGAKNGAADAMSRLELTTVPNSIAENKEQKELFFCAHAMTVGFRGWWGIQTSKRCIKRM